MKKFLFIAMMLLISTAFSFATGCAKEPQTTQTPTELNFEFSGHPCIFVYKLQDMKTVDNVFISVSGEKIEWISPTADVLQTYKGYVISNTMRYGSEIRATSMKQSEFSANRDTGLLLLCKIDGKPFTECWEWKYETANLKTLYNAINSGLSDVNFYRKM